MSTPAIDTLGSYLNKSQVPFDRKLHVNTLEELQDLGIGYANAFTYYEDMEVKCIEDHNTYVWREETTAGETGGIAFNEARVLSSYTYPNNLIANGIDYSGRTFNFFLKTFDGANVSGLSDKADKSNVIEKDNTEVFTPTADYQPATKKFVEDTVVNGEIYVDSITTSNNSITFTLTNGVVTTITDVAKLNVVSEFVRQQYFKTNDLTDSSVVSWDLDLAQNAYLEMTAIASRDINATNIKDGGEYSIAIKQDSVGSRLAIFGSMFEFGDVQPTLSTGANKTDIYTWRGDGNKLFFTGISKGFDNYNN